MASGPDSGLVQVVHGANERTLPLSGRLIGDAKRSLRDIFNIPYFASAFLNGAVVDLGHLLSNGDRLEFLQTFGFKGSGDRREPARTAEALIQDSPELQRISDQIKSSRLNKDDSVDETVRLVSRYFVQFYGPYGSQERPILSEVARLLLSHECRITEIEAKLVGVTSELPKPSDGLHKVDPRTEVLERPQFNASRMTMTWKGTEHPFGTGKEFVVLKYLATKFENYVSYIDAIPLPQSVPWPTLDAAALHGLAGEVVRRIEPETEADPIAILISTLVCVGNCVGRGVWFPVEGNRHHANIFACLVGETSRGRKGTSLGRTLMLWPDADAWKSDCIVNGLSSGEGLKWAVRDAVEAMEPVKEKEKEKGKVVAYQSVIKDHGVADKRLLVVESEFSQALKAAQREGNTLSPVIRQAWDTGTLRTMTRNDPTVATNAHISIIGHITRQELVKDLSETDCSNGYANRFLWIAVKRSKMLPDGGEQIDLSPLGTRLNQAIAQVSGQMTRSPAARKLWHQQYPKLTADRAGIWGKVTSRGEAQTLRLSMIFSLLDGTTIIDVPHLEAAIAVWNYAEASARLIFAEVEETDPLERVLLEKITVSPGINRKSLHKALGGHIKAEAMVKALGSLAGQGKVRSEMVPTGGRRSECWWPVTTPGVLPLTVDSADKATSDANERTKFQASPSVVQSQDGSFVRSGDAHEDGGNNGEPSNGKAHAGTGSPPSLAELFAEVQKLDGKIVRSANGTFAVEGVEQGLLTPGMVAALVVHRDELALVVPPRQGVSHVEVKPMTFEEQRHAEWLKRYEAAQAKRLAREAELLKDPMSPEEWNRSMDEMLERQKRRAT